MSQTVVLFAFTLPIRVTMPTLSLAVECCHLASAPWDAITPITFHFPSSVTPFPTVRPGLQRREIAEPFKDDKTPPHKFISHRTGMSLDSSIVSE